MAAAPGTGAGQAGALLRAPGLVVITGPPGCGRTTTLRRLASAAPGPAFSGGGLAMLAGVPALALSRAVSARLPVHDVHLLAEAVRSRVRGGLLVLDDLQYVDPVTLAALPLIAAHCRVLAALRTPHRLASSLLDALRSAATGWLPVPPLTSQAAADLVRRTSPQLDAAAVAEVAARAGGNPLAITALARQAAAGHAPASQDIDQIAYAIATALADLARPARTALAALGLLGRPAGATLLGPGAADLLTAGLVTADARGDLAPVSTYVAETAAGLLDGPARAELHLRLATLTPPAEAARHLAAGGDAAGAYVRALQAADRASGADRATLLLFACELEVPVDGRVRVAAADAALAAGRPVAAARVLTTDVPLGPEADVLRGEALLQAGDPAGARAAVQPIPDAAPVTVVAARDRVLVLAALATDPEDAADLAGKIAARHPHPAPGVAAALAAVQAHRRRPGWAEALTDAARAAAGDPLIGRATAWLLVECLVADGRLTEAAAAALAAAAGAAVDLAYAWETRFLAAADWALALHGSGLGLPTPGGTSPATPDPAVAPAATGAAPSESGVSLSAGGAVVPESAAEAGSSPYSGSAGAAGGGFSRTQAHGVDEVLRRAANLADRSLPAEARGYATAATALIEADTGLLAAARGRLKGAPEHPATAWVAREAAWLDGQPDLAAREAAESPAGLLAGLHAITARWAAFDLGVTSAPGIPGGVPGTVRRTLTAWATGMGFAAAAEGWRPVALREQIRCLLAAGLTDSEPGRAVAALLQAEQLADAAGLTVLAGRARRGLRRHHVHRDTRSPRAGSQLTRREADVLRLVAAGEPTRRIAGQLGISAETVDTHIRASMRKLGARTRTEAAALAFSLDTADAAADGVSARDGREGR